MEDFLFHNVSEEEKEKIKRDAKKMIDSFSEKISRIKVEEKGPNVKREEFERGEGAGQECDLSFKKIMFENAPNKSSDFIIAEKKKWE